MPDDERDWRTEIATLNELLASYRAELERRPGPEEYGLSLRVEQEKNRLLIGAIEEAAPLVEALYTLLCDRVIGDPRGPLANGAKAWLTHPTVVAALREAKG